MPNEIAAISAVTAAMPTTSSDLSYDRPQREAEVRANNYRLVIEQGPRSGSFVYKTVDRTTGETIKQYPREEVLKLLTDPTYAAGTVASTTA